MEEESKRSRLRLQPPVDHSPVDDQSLIDGWMETWPVGHNLDLLFPSPSPSSWRRNRFVNQTMTSSKSKETSGGWSLINHVLRTPTASSPLWSGSRIFFLLLSSNLRLGTLVIWYPRTKCYQSAWKEKKEKEKIRDSSQPLTGHWRPNFSRPFWY